MYIIYIRTERQITLLILFGGSTREMDNSHKSYYS